MGKERECGMREVFKCASLGQGLAKISRFWLNEMSVDAVSIITLIEALCLFCRDMSLIHASRHIASRGTCLRSSYAEISRYFGTRHHGITPSQAASCSSNAARCFSSSRPVYDVIEPDETLRKTLHDFKATSMSTMNV